LTTGGNDLSPSACSPDVAKGERGKRIFRMQIKEGKTSETHLWHSVMHIHIRLPMWIYHGKQIFKL